ncbi:AGE family epimerase/isomerase [Paraliobacillus sediminis]|uniref:AGE family epimerase/isomerase n=1 Tax=Paraliobacillus sediminis TaxID=1885916 RepID=UPI003B82F09D
MNISRIEIEKHLTESILPFWIKLKDQENGGFYGQIDYNLAIDKKADKGGIATARFLWTFSAAYRVTKDEKYLEYADHLYEFLVESVIDHEHKGLYWLVDYQGNPKDARKHVYTQSFGIYALSEYYRATKNEAALKLANQLYQLVEEKGFNKKNDAYMEEFNREWEEIPNEMLSENGVIANITMNTHIHILEAYTNLYKADPSEKLKARLESLMKVHYEKIYNKKTKFLGVFFNENWESILDIKSFGHDIEASWLMDETIKVIGLENLEYHQMVKDIAYNIADYAVQADGSLINEQEKEHTDYTRVWWVQAEAMVGYLNAFERTNDPKFEVLLANLWKYMKEYLIDPRDGGEWFWSVDDNGKPSERNIGEPWKTSYHNSRFCLEYMERMSK